MLKVRDLYWMEYAACKGMDTELFFPPAKTEPSQEALDACEICPVLDQCLSFALVSRPEGLWGGLTKKQRHAINRKRHRATCAQCQSTRIQAQDTAHNKRSEICLNCGLSWIVT